MSEIVERTPYAVRIRDAEQDWRYRCVRCPGCGDWLVDGQLVLVDGVVSVAEPPRGVPLSAHLRAEHDDGGTAFGFDELRERPAVPRRALADGGDRLYSEAQCTSPESDGGGGTTDA